MLDEKLNALVDYTYIGLKKPVAGLFWSVLLTDQVAARAQPAR
jgi:hypothetical protein